MDLLLFVDQLLDTCFGDKSIIGQIWLLQAHLMVILYKGKDCRISFHKSTIFKPYSKEFHIYIY